MTTPTHVTEILRYADGAIVGTALVAALDRGIEPLRDLAGALAAGTARGAGDVAPVG